MNGEVFILTQGSRYGVDGTIHIIISGDTKRFKNSTKLKGTHKCFRVFVTLPTPHIERVNPAIYDAVGENGKCLWKKL